MKLSNSMADKAERAKVELAGYVAAERQSIAHALAAGTILAEARDQAAHGEWGPFLARAGVHERQARRLIQLGRSGLKSDAVSALGGVTAALTWLGGRKLPDDDHGLIITLGDDPAKEKAVFVSRWQGGYRLFCIEPGGVIDEMTRPVMAEGVWMFADLLLGGRTAEMEFHSVSDHGEWEQQYGLAKAWPDTVDVLGGRA